MAGPVSLGLVGPVALSTEAAAVVVVASFDGAPRALRVPLAPPAVPLSWAPPASTVPVRASSPPCALAGDDAYCIGRSGTVTRSSLARPGAAERIAEARPLSPLAALALPTGRSLVAYLRERMTAEGALVEAFVAASPARVARLSEDGSGATSVALARRGDRIVALALDARAAMATLHARELTADGAGLSVGPDAVLAVAGPVEPGTSLLAAGVGAQLFALMAASRDALAFGLAAYPVRAPAAPAEAAWSLYPNGLTPAPLSAATAAGRTLVARARPEAAAVGSPKVIEVGELTSEGRFVAAGAIAASDRIAHLATVSDRYGTLWIAQGDGVAPTTLARIRCDR